MIEFYDTDIVCYRCKASTWECIGTFQPRKGRKEDVLECSFCGVRERVPSPIRPNRERIDAEPEPHGEFRFQYGRFKGMTMAEADSQPNGRRYLEVMRETNDKLRDRITEYLTTAAPSA